MLRFCDCVVLPLTVGFVGVSTENVRLQKQLFHDLRFLVLCLSRCWDRRSSDTFGGKPHVPGHVATVRPSGGSAAPARRSGGLQTVRVRGWAAGGEAVRYSSARRGGGDGAVRVPSDGALSEGPASRLRADMRTGPDPRRRGAVRAEAEEGRDCGRAPPRQARVPRHDVPGEGAHRVPLGSGSNGRHRQLWSENRKGVKIQWSSVVMLTCEKGRQNKDSTVMGYAG